MTISPAVTPTLHAELRELSERMCRGDLDARAAVAGFAGEDAAVIEAINAMLDAVVTPLQTAAGAINELAHGRIPPFILDEQSGGDNELKRNLNTLLATLYGMHNETRHLVTNIRDGKLRSRGNDWDYEGIWKELIGGVNGTLDAVIAPVQEASTILGRLADYDLAARMRGRYRGEHAQIKKAMNATAGSLRGAISQVGETVTLVSEVGASIARSSEAVARGALDQDAQLAQTTHQLSLISVAAEQSAHSVQQAGKSAEQASAAVGQSKEAAAQMLTTMAEIVGSADNMAVIVQEIDAIAKETDALSTSASVKARTVRSSADGFGVVADTIRGLSDRCETAVEGLNRLGRDLKAQADGRLHEQVQAIHKELHGVATVAELLGINAAIEAAHVAGAGQDFTDMTEEIRQLAKRSAEATQKTEELIKASIVLVRKGMGLSEAIDGQLIGAVEGAEAIRRLTEQLAAAAQEQASAVGEISRSVAQIKAVTESNTTTAQASSAAAQDLQGHVQKLAMMVEKFRLVEAS